METTTNLLDKFETETCSRCGGSGNYSYCQMYGHTCFRCKGNGRTYTKRGQAALEWARDQRMVNVSDVKVGWLVFEDGIGPFGGKRGWFPVISIDESAFGHYGTYGEIIRHVSITTEQCGHSFDPNSPHKIQAVPSKDRIREIKQQALGYQSTLTKAGTPRKRSESAIPAEVTR